MIVGASYANPGGKPGAGKSYIVFGKTDSSAIDLSVIANTNNPTGGFVINGGINGTTVGFTKHNIRFTCT
jgi:Neuraminidase (sialidase)